MYDWSNRVMDCPVSGAKRIDEAIESTKLLVVSLRR
jgi:hypothetical protein